MPDYILPPQADLSRDPSLFPLLTEGRRETHQDLAIRYPLTIAWADGGREPLLIGGVASRQELERIASGCAAAILSRHAGQRLLLLELLEGASFFYNLVVAALDTAKGAAGCTVHHAAIKISSYTDGSRATSHQLSRPLHHRQGRPLPDLAAIDAICVLDDLIDAGATFAWLLTEYLPAVTPVAAEGYFMLDKERPRAPWIQELLGRCNPVNGKLVPDQWLVGYGPDITVAGSETLAPLHLFRGELPGGVYAFNSAIERQLTAAYHRQPRQLRDHLAPYITAC